MNAAWSIAMGRPVADDRAKKVSKCYVNGAVDVARSDPTVTAGAGTIIDTGNY